METGTCVTHGEDLCSQVLSQAVCHQLHLVQSRHRVQGQQQSVHTLLKYWTSVIAWEMIHIQLTQDVVDLIFCLIMNTKIFKYAIIICTLLRSLCIGYMRVGSFSSHW